MRRMLLLFTTTIALMSTADAKDADRLVVHEWGTFTELQSFEGTTVGGINTDDEPVPDFVHRISNNLLLPTVEPWRQAFLRRGKSLAWSDRVTTRLETPVIYFYPPAEQKLPMKLDVEVQLRGGWLSEYYPNAETNAPGLYSTGLGRHAAGSLQWRNLLVGVDAKVPDTDDPVWVAPRLPQSATVATPEGEAEEYLFYRGVGRFSGPLRVETDEPNNQLRLVSQLHTVDHNVPHTIPAAWLVDVAPDGSVAFRNLGSFSASESRPELVATVPRNFEVGDYSPKSLDALRTQMHLALVNDGLYPDEATAMLATWRRAYFESPGKRIFYLLPQEWTDDRMPLTLSVQADVERVMMGRIELVTDQQEALLQELSEHRPGSSDWIKQVRNNTPAAKRFLSGDNTAATKLGIEFPPEYEAYLSLGRFRNALVNHACRETENENLRRFASLYGLQPKN